MQRNLTFLIFLTILSGFFSLTAFGQRATSFELITNEKTTNGNYLYLKVNGKKRLISEEAFDVWLFNKGKEVAYTTRGAGFDGEAFWLYDVATEKVRLMIAKNSVAVIGITEVKLSNGIRVILVRLSDIGDIFENSIGGSYVAVIEPQHGQVLFLENAELTNISGDLIKISFYHDNNWERINKRRREKDYQDNTAIAPRTKLRPYKTRTLDLKKVIKNKVIVDELSD